MEKYANYHDHRMSMVQSAVNEFVQKNEKLGPGLHGDHKQLKALTESLDKLPKKKTLIKIVSALSKIIRFFQKLFGIKGNSTFDECIELITEYAEAALSGNEQRMQEIKNEKKFSNCDLLWAESVFEWFDHYKLEHGKAHYVDYNSIDDFAYPLPPSDSALRVGLIADWGTGEEVAEVVLDQLFEMKPDVVVHLGDIYYSGTEKECKENFLDIVNRLRQKHSRNIPVYNLPGNHDYYSGGKPFYDTLKPLNDNVISGSTQEASYFTLSNDKWHLQGMDTGYNDRDVLRVGKDNTHLRDKEVIWHRHHLDKAVDNGKKIILLSHHQLFSKFMAIGDTAYNVDLHDHFKEYLDKGQIDAWFWGHEHLFELYEPHLNLDKGRCIGHAAVPVLYKDGAPYQQVAEKNGKPLPDLPKLMPESILPNNGDVYDHGFALMELNPDQTGKVSYHSVDGDGNPPTAKLNYEETF